MEQDLSLSKNQTEHQYLIGTNQFVLLSILTFGLYYVWWFYKVWRFFGQLEHRSFAPALRAIFGIFFSIVLFEKILVFAKGNGYQRGYSSTWLFIGLLATSLFSWLPDPFFIVSHVGIICLIPPFEAFNYALAHDARVSASVQPRLNTRQIILIVIGSLLWVLTIIGVVLNLTGYYIYD